MSCVSYDNKMLSQLQLALETIAYAEGQINGPYLLKEKLESIARKHTQGEFKYAGDGCLFVLSILGLANQLEYNERYRENNPIENYRYTDPRKINPRTNVPYRVKVDFQLLRDTLANFENLLYNANGDDNWEQAIPNIKEIMSDCESVLPVLKDIVLQNMDLVLGKRTSLWSDFVRTEQADEEKRELERVSQAAERDKQKVIEHKTPSNVVSLADLRR